MEYLCIFATAVGLITVVGHGIWVLFAKVFGSLGHKKSEREEQPDRCRNCRDLIPYHARKCPGCGMSRSAGDEAAELRVMTRQLNDFRSAGEIDGASFNRMNDLIYDRLRVLRGRAAPRPTPNPTPNEWTEEPSPAHVESLAPPADIDELPRPVESARPNGPNAAEPPHGGELPSLPISDKLGSSSPLSENISASGVDVEENVSNRPPDLERSAEPNVEAPPTVEPMPPSRSTPHGPLWPAKTVAAPVAVERERQSWGKWLGAFLEQRNIFWGELIGGLLIVGCSIALILSLWQTLESIPLFPFLAATTTTAALYGVGRYSLSHWKLESSSRGLLVIATLLVPLNFLVLAGISPRSNNLLEVAAKIAAVAVFALMVRSAGRVLLPDPVGWHSRMRGWLIALAVVGPALAPLLAARAYDPDGIMWPFVLLVAFPVACHVVAIAGAVLAHRRLGSRGLAAAPVLGWVGFATYSLAVSVTFLVFWVSSQEGLISFVLGPLAAPAVVAGASILVAGLFVQRRASASSADELGGSALGVLATGIALLGGLVQLAAFGMAWPERGTLLIVGMANFLFLTVVSFRFRFPPAQLLALPSLLVTFLLAVSLLSAPHTGSPFGENAGLTGTSLIGLVVAPVFIAEILLRKNRTADARAYQIGAGVIVLLGLGLSAVDSVAEPRWATITGSACAAICLVIGRRWGFSILEQVGIALASLTSIAALHWGMPGDYPAWATVLAAEALAISALRGTWWRPVIFAAILAGAAAMRGWEEIHSTWHTATAMLLSASAFVQAGRWRLAQLTWYGAAMLLAGIAHGLILGTDTPQAMPWVTVLLVFSSVSLIASLVELKQSAFPLREVFALPMRWSALAASSLAAANLLTGIDQHLLGPQAILAFWLGAIWLAAALAERRLPWFIAFQIAATSGVSLGVGYYLEEQARLAEASVSFTNASACYAFGLGLGGIVLLWAVMRRTLERRRFFGIYFEANWFDHLLLGALVVAQLAVAGWLVVPEVAREIAPLGALQFNGVFHPGTVLDLASGPWLLLGLLGIALILTVRSNDRQRTAALVVGFGCLAVSAPLLAAGRVAPELASASALRWWLAAACALVAAPFWVRRWKPAAASAEAPGVVLSVLIMLPVLVVSAATTVIILSGYVPAGPAKNSLFDRLGWSASHGLPMTVIALTLLGHAIREGHARYALMAGVLATLSAGFGYAVESVLAGVRFDERIIAAALQRATAAAALISAAWISAVALARRRSGLASSNEPAPLWSAQQAIAVGGNLLLLGSAGLFLALAVPDLAGPSIPPTYPVVPGWIVIVAGVWGWVSLTLTVGAGLLPQLLSRRNRSTDAMALSVLGIFVLIACGIAVGVPAWGYRTLMLGMAAVAVAAAWGARHSEAFDRWVAIASGLAVALALKATLLHGDSLAAVSALAAASVAGLWLSLRRERPDWACVAGVGAQIAIITALWHGLRPQPIADWPAYLLQSVVATAALLMLLGHWLRDRGRAGPNLFTQLQQAIVAGGLLILFAIPILQLVIEPASASSMFAAQSGELSGLGALLIVSAALFLFSRRHSPALLVHLLGGFALLAAAWVALAAARHWPGWPAYHTLMVGMALAAAGTILGKGRKSERWMVVFTTVLTGLALRSAWQDPLQPYFPAGAALLAAAIVAVQAIRQARLAHVWASCGLLTLAGFFIWVTWGIETVPNLIATLTASLATAAIVWFAMDRRLSIPFRETAVVAGAMLVVMLAGWGLVEVIGPASREVPGGITWMACGIAMIAALFGLLTPAVRSASASLYALGMCSIVFMLLEPRWSAEAMIGPAAVAFAGYLLIVQLIERRRSLCPISTWFTAAQLGFVAVVVLLSLPATLQVASTTARLAGPLALALIGATIVLLALRNTAALARGLEHAVFGLAVLLFAEAGWAIGNPSGTAPWLHGMVALLAAVGLVVVAAALLVPRFTRMENRWSQAARRTGPILGALGGVVLGIVLLQELYFFDRNAGGVPLSGFEAGVVAAAMIGLMAAALAFAVRPGIDPFGLSGSGRKGYVYGAEAVLALLFLHVRLNVPGLMPTPVGGTGWAFTVMVIAFAGVGLAEFFRRRGLEVLADPIHRTGILLPALPLLAFWLIPAPGGEPASMRSYSLLWLVAGSLYGVLALTRRSYAYVLGAALAMNAAVWALYAHEGIGFLVHPQLWLVPMALIVLVSEFFHRDHLTPELASGLRYGGLVMLYISSTADVFVAGPGDSAPLLLVLAVLSVVGVLAGILLRIRAYLFLGSGFLTMVVFRMIWHAAVERDQSWVWWACGIVLGVLVLAVFAVLERRGQKVREALERFREWH